MIRVFNWSSLIMPSIFTLAQSLLYAAQCESRWECRRHLGRNTWYIVDANVLNCVRMTQNKTIQPSLFASEVTKPIKFIKQSNWELEVSIVSGHRRQVPSASGIFKPIGAVTSGLIRNNRVIDVHHPLSRMGVCCLVMSCQCVCGTDRWIQRSPSFPPASDTWRGSELIPLLHSYLLSMQCANMLMQCKCPCGVCPRVWGPRTCSGCRGIVW